MKLRTLLNEIGFLGMVSETGFVNNPPVAKRGPKSIKEDDDFINPGNPASVQAKKDDYDLDTMPPHMKDDEPDWAEVLGDAAEDLDDVATSVEMQKDTIVRVLREYGEKTGQTDYDQMAGKLERYYNGILDNIELTQKGLNKGF